MFSLMLTPRHATNVFVRLPVPKSTTRYVGARPFSFAGKHRDDVENVYCGQWISQSM